MTFADDLRQILHSARAIPGEMGLRLFSVSILAQPANAGDTWNGSTSTHEPVATPLTEAGGQNPKVRWISPKDLLAGYPPSVELEVRITPDLVASIEQINIESPETVWLVQGPGLGPDGARFSKEFVNTESALHWTIGLRRVSAST